MVARSGRRCAAVDVGGFDAASSHDITPMRQVIRASSPHVPAHAVSCREAAFLHMAAQRPTSLLHTLAPSIRPTPWGELTGRCHGANR
ncbi:hypothetical protein EBJ67_15845 [Salmonella enterica subsp. enterica serovar Bovismorbificans]|nr:hypothetical protein [Salmonella enterica subsp. enterica serovar Bovismorbificans]